MCTKAGQFPDLTSCEKYIDCVLQGTNNLTPK